MKTEIYIIKSSCTLFTNYINVGNEVTALRVASFVLGKSKESRNFTNL
jgi:hypothetical protein